LFFTIRLLAGQDLVESAVQEMDLQQIPEVKNGRIAIVEGEVGPEGVRLSVHHLDILQPVEIMLLSEGPQDELRIELFKYTDQTIARQGSTRGTGAVIFGFRTQDDVQIRLTSPEGSKNYRIAVWAGEPADTPLPPVLVAAHDTIPTKSGFPAVVQTGNNSMLLGLWVLATGVVLIAGLLVILTVRKRRV